MFKVRVGAGLLVLALVMLTSTDVRPAVAASARRSTRCHENPEKLYADIPEARHLSTRAKGILVFPSIVKAGFLFGAQFGEGAMRRQGKTVGYYNTWRLRTASRPESRRSGTSCSS